MNVQLQKGDKLNNYVATYVTETTGDAITNAANAKANGNRSLWMRDVLKKASAPYRPKAKRIKKV